MTPQYDHHARVDGGPWVHLCVSEHRYPPISRAAVRDYDVFITVLRGHDPDDGAIQEAVTVEHYLEWGQPAPEGELAGGVHPQHAILLEWDRGRSTMRCIESAVRNMSLCGRRLPDARRVVYQPATSHDDKHVSLCFDCTTVGNGGSVPPRRRDLHF